MHCMKAAKWGVAVLSCLCVGGIKAAPTATPTPSTNQATVKPTAVFCTATKCKNGGHCSVGDTSCTCLAGFSGKTCKVTPSPTPVPTQAPVATIAPTTAIIPSPTSAPTASATPTSAPTKTPTSAGSATATPTSTPTLQQTLSPVAGTPLPCRKVFSEVAPINFILASGTYSITSSLVCVDFAIFTSTIPFYEVPVGSVVVINIPVEGVTLTNFPIIISGGSVTINGGPITYVNYKPAHPFSVYDGGILTINSDVVYTANAYQMIICGSKNYGNNVGRVVRSGGIVTFAGSGSFTSNALGCDPTKCYDAAVFSLNNGCSITFKKNVEFKSNSVPTSSGSTAIFSHGGALVVYESTLVFEADALFDTNKAYGGGALFLGFGSTVTFKGLSTFVNNNAVNFGGGIVNMDSTVKFEQGSVFLGNIAVGTSTLAGIGGSVHNLKFSALYPFPSTSFCTALPTGTDVSVTGTAEFNCSGCQTTIATC